MMIAKIALQVMLGLIFLFIGMIKLFTPKEKLVSKGVTGFESIAPQYIKIIALTEMAGAMVLLIFSLPALPPCPVKIAVTGFAMLMTTASYHHLKKKGV